MLLAHAEMQNVPLPGTAWSEPATSSFETTYAETARLLQYIAVVRFRIPREDADALVQDVYLKFLRDYAQVRAPRKWLAAAVSNACRNYLRDRGRETPLPDDAENWADPASSGEVDRIVARLTVAEALSRLGERCRGLLRRFHLDGESTQSIADTLGTTAGNVQFMLHSCRKKARSIFTELSGGRQR
jgi:RNA polymerase sigma factor (sigma-70 family)